MPDPPDTWRDWLGMVGEGWSSWIVSEWAVAREVSRLCPERDAPTDRVLLGVASGSPFSSLLVDPDIPKEP